MTATLHNRHLHFDGSSGAAGDMIVAALLDLGVPEQPIRDALDRVGMGGDRLTVKRVVKRGVSALDVRVRVEPDGDAHHHTHYRDIARRIAGAGLEPEVGRRSQAIFELLARAEAAVHQTSLEEVAFHEVGAIDSIVDVVAAAAALAYLAPAAISASPVAVGGGTVATAHGLLPVPAPATLEILRVAGGQMVDGGVARELCTPTGAAILAASADRWGPPPPLTPIAIGYGAGDADLDDRANVVRALLGAVAAGAAEPVDLFRIEANIDDMSAELAEHVAGTLFERGAVDVWWTPITMKKSRPALLLTALAPAVAREAVVEGILRETTSIGVRFDPVGRRVLAREIESVTTEYGPLPIKVARIGDQVVNAAPEYEPCRRAAAAHGVPLKQVFAAALAAYHTGRRAP